MSAKSISAWREYTLLTAVPITRAERVWIKHEAAYRRSERTPGLDDSSGSMGSVSSKEAPINELDDNLGC
jgi:hypothetical protein